MAEEKQPAAEATQPAPAEIEGLVSQARASGYAEASLIAELCAIAGKPAEAVRFIGEKKTAEQVRAELLKARVEAAGAELNTSVMPGADAKGAEKPAQGKAKPWSEIFKALGIKAKEGK